MLVLTTSMYIFMFVIWIIIVMEQKKESLLVVLARLCLWISLQSIKITKRAHSHSSHIPHRLLPLHEER